MRPIVMSGPHDARLAVSASLRPRRAHHAVDLVTSGWAPIGTMQYLMERASVP